MWLWALPGQRRVCATCCVVVCEVLHACVVLCALGCSETYISKGFVIFTPRTQKLVNLGRRAYGGISKVGISSKRLHDVK